MVTKLVTEEAALTEIKKLGKGQKVRFAVAFWGTNSVDKLKVKATAGAEILCNLQSGCCDPDEIENLTKMNGVKVLAHSSLHAKVYISPKGALVGSSNASTNGLAMDGNLAGSWREANLLVANEPLLADLDTWFAERWAEGKKITNPMLAAARKKWEDRKRRNVIGTHSEDGLTLLGSAIRSPGEYDGLPIYIAISKQNASKEAIKAVDDKKKAKYKGPVYTAQDEGTSQGGSREALSDARWWTYEEWVLEPDSWYIDCSIRTRVKVSGIARTINPVLTAPFTDRDGKQGTAYIAFRTPMAIPVAGADLPFPPSDRRIIEAYAETLWRAAKGLGDDGGRSLPLADAARRLRRIQEVRTQFNI